jgi:hypothetical protein
MTEETNTPYCSECNSCGEEGCCSPLKCKQSPNGEYCSSNLTHLKFGYHMNMWMTNNLLNLIPKELKEKYDQEWDNSYDRFYNTKN